MPRHNKGGELHSGEWFFASLRFFPLFRSSGPALNFGIRGYIYTHRYAASERVARRTRRRIALPRGARGSGREKLAGAIGRDPIMRLLRGSLYLASSLARGSMALGGLGPVACVCQCEKLRVVVDLGDFGGAFDLYDWGLFRVVLLWKNDVTSLRRQDDVGA